MSSWCMHLFSLQSSLIDSLRIWAFTVCICPNIQWARTTDLAWIRLPVTTKIVKHLLCWPTTRTFTHHWTYGCGLLAKVHLSSDGFISDDHMGQNIWWSTPLDCLGWPWIALDGLGLPWMAFDFFEWNGYNSFNDIPPLVNYIRVAENHQK